MREWMTTADLADYLSVAHDQVEEWVREGAIPFHRRLEMLRFHKAEIDAWMRGERYPQSEVPASDPQISTTTRLESIQGLVRRAFNSGVLRSHGPTVQNRRTKGAIRGRIERPGWAFLAEWFGPGRLTRLRRGIALLEERPIRVAISKYYTPDEGFRRRACWWVDLPEAFFKQEATKDLLLVLQETATRLDRFHVLRIPHEALDANCFDLVRVAEKPVRRIHIDVETFDEMRRGEFNFRRFLLMNSPNPPRS